MLGMSSGNLGMLLVKRMWLFDLGKEYKSGGAENLPLISTGAANC
jgi:hypothetical protein